MTLYTEEHIAHQKEVIADCPAYAQSALMFAPMVSELIESNRVTELLDYGCGEGLLAANLQLSELIPVYNYDPAFDDYAEAPNPTDMVVCLDVLDNVEPASIDAVLADLVRVTKRIGFFSIHTSVDESVADQAFRTLKSAEWWLEKLMKLFPNCIISPELTTDLWW